MGCSSGNQRVVGGRGKVFKTSTQPSAPPCEALHPPLPKIDVPLISKCFSLEVCFWELYSLPAGHLLHLIGKDFFCLIGGHTQLNSGITLGSVLWVDSEPCCWGGMRVIWGAKDLNSGWPHARPVPYCLLLQPLIRNSKQCLLQQGSACKLLGFLLKCRFRFIGSQEGPENYAFFQTSFQRLLLVALNTFWVDKK